MIERPSTSQGKHPYKVEFYDRMGRLLRAQTRVAENHVQALEIGWAVVDEGASAVTFVTSMLPRDFDYPQNQGK